MLAGEDVTLLELEKKMSEILKQKQWLVTWNVNDDNLDMTTRGMINE